MLVILLKQIGGALCLRQSVKKSFVFVLSNFSVQH